MDIKMENEIADIIRRLSNLEKMSFISIISIGVSIIAVFVSILSYIKNNSLTKDNALTNIKSNIDDAKSHYENLCMEASALKAKENLSTEEQRELKLKKSICDSAFEKVLNAYDDGCVRFFNGKVNKKDFKEKYHQDLVKYVTEFPEKFEEPLTHYGHLLKYYKEFHKMQKT
jgi:cell division protein FtsL